MATRLSPRARRLQTVRERLIEALLFLAAAFSVLVTLGIIGVLVYESAQFFTHVSVFEFLTGTVWTPLFANPQYGILPLPGQAYKMAMDRFRGGKTGTGFGSTPEVGLRVEEILKREPQS